MVFVTRVLAQAIVDPVPSTPRARPWLHGSPIGIDRLPVWAVTVTGKMYAGGDLPERRFTIAARSDTLAAQEGLDRFVREFQGLE